MSEGVGAPGSLVARSSDARSFKIEFMDEATLKSLDELLNLDANHVIFEHGHTLYTLDLNSLRNCNEEKQTVQQVEA